MSLSVAARSFMALRAVRRADVAASTAGAMRRLVASRYHGWSSQRPLPHPCRCFASSRPQSAASAASSASTRRFSSPAAEPAADAPSSPFIPVSPVAAPAPPPEPIEQAEVRHFLSSLPVDLSEHADKFLSFSHVLNASTRALKGMGLSIKHRKLLLRQRERYKEAMRRLEHQQVLQAARASAAAATASSPQSPHLSAQQLQQALYDVSYAQQYARQWRRAEEREAAHWWRQSVEMDRLRKSWVRNEWNGVHVQTKPPSMKPLRNPQAMKQRLEEEVKHLQEQEQSGLADFLDRLAVIEDSQLEDENWTPVLDEQLLERRMELKEDDDLRESIKEEFESRIERVLDGEPVALNAVRKELGLPPIDFPPPAEIVAQSDDGEQEEQQQQPERNIDVQVVSSGEQQLSELKPAQEEGKKEEGDSDSGNREQSHAMQTSPELGEQVGEQGEQKDGSMDAEGKAEGRVGLDAETMAALQERLKQENPELDKEADELEARLMSDPELQQMDASESEGDADENLEAWLDDTLEEMVDEVIDGPEVEPGLRYIISEELHNYDWAKDLEMEDGPPLAPPTKEELVQTIDDMKSGRIHQRLDYLDIKARQMLTLEGLERKGTDWDQESFTYREKQGEEARIEAEVRWRQQQRDLRVKANLESASPVPPTTIELEALPEYGIEAQTIVVPAEPKDDEDKRDPLVIKLDDQRFRQQSLQKLFAPKKDTTGGR